MNLPTFDHSRDYGRALDGVHLQSDIDTSLEAALRAVEADIREAFAYGFREALGLVPCTFPMEDEGRLMYARVEATFDRALADVLAQSVTVRGKLHAAMKEPNAARAQRMLKAAELAIVEHHIATHAPRLAKLRAFPDRRLTA